MGVWIKNLEEVIKHNARFEAGEETYTMRMNHFGDLSTEEFSATYLMKKPEVSAPKNACENQFTGNGFVGDATVDWTTKGAVTPIKNQGQCGSCWAFSATGSMEGAYQIKNGKLLSFSEQQLVDCSKSYGNNGCGGGLMDYAFTYVLDHGITTEDKYPYAARGQTCKQQEGEYKISSCSDVKKESNAALKEAIEKGPVSVAIQANKLGFQLYHGGVFSGNCGTNLDHGVLAVGYGTDGKSYIKVKNSWGAGWGEQGFIRIEDRDEKGQCGINMDPTIAFF